MNEQKTSNNFQREGSVSNAHVGRNFELLAKEFLARKGLDLKTEFPLKVGISSRKKAHKFDLGSENLKVIVECKSHTWTSGDNTPSAKIQNWSQAMYYFAIAPKDYQKIFFIEKSVKRSSGETLGEYYLRTHYHLIPEGVEFWEYDIESKEARILP